MTWCTYCRKTDHSDAECWCTRVANLGGAGSGIGTFDLREAPGFHPVKPLFSCRDPEHGMPTHLHIPPGQKFVHYCPTCGHKSSAFGAAA